MYTPWHSRRRQRAVGCRTAPVGYNVIALERGSPTKSRRSDLPGEPNVRHLLPYSMRFNMIIEWNTSDDNYVNITPERKRTREVGPTHPRRTQSMCYLPLSKLRNPRNNAVENKRNPSPPKISQARRTTQYDSTPQLFPLPVLVCNHRVLVFPTDIRPHLHVAMPARTQQNNERNHFVTMKLVTISPPRQSANLFVCATRGIQQGAEHLLALQTLH